MNYGVSLCVFWWSKATYERVIWSQRACYPRVEKCCPRAYWSHQQNGLGPNLPPIGLFSFCFVLNHSHVTQVSPELPILRILHAESWDDRHKPDFYLLARLVTEVSLLWVGWSFAIKNCLFLTSMITWNLQNCFLPLPVSHSAERSRLSSP